MPSQVPGSLPEAVTHARRRRLARTRAARVILPTLLAALLACLLAPGGATAFELTRAEARHLADRFAKLA